MSLRMEYDRELQRLDGMLLDMSRAVTLALMQAMACWEGSDREGARQVMAGDSSINAMEKQVEQLCLSLLLRQHPVAGDLRRVSAALKMVTDLERVGDHAQDIAELSLFMSAPAARPGWLAVVQKMYGNANWMLEAAAKAWAGQDTSLAAAVIAQDDTVDNAFLEIKGLLGIHIAQSGREIDEALDWLMLAKYLERVADHAVNLAEWVTFCQTGIHQDAKII